jgi:uncharacterized protein with HEPN domain
MADVPEHDAALLLDMLLAARDARGFADGLTKQRFLSSRLHQNAIIRSLEVIGEAAGRQKSGVRSHKKSGVRSHM